MSSTELISVAEAKKLLKGYGVPLGSHVPFTRTTERDWPVIDTEDGLMVDRIKLALLAARMPRWLFVIANGELDSRCGYMAIPHVEKEFGLRREEILDGIKSGEFMTYDRGQNLHPVLRYIIHRGSATDYVQRKGKENHGSSDEPNVNSTEAGMNPGRFCEMHQIDLGRLQRLIREGLLPWFENHGSTGRGSRYTISAANEAALVADEELMNALKSGGRLSSALRMRLTNGELRPCQNDMEPDDVHSATAQGKEVPEQKTAPTAPSQTPPPITSGDERTKRLRSLAKIGEAFLIVEAAKAAIARGEDPFQAVFEVLP